MTVQLHTLWELCWASTNGKNHKTLSWFKYVVTKPSRKYSSKWLILQCMRSVCSRVITTMTFDMISPTKNIDSIVFKKVHLFLHLIIPNIHSFIMKSLSRHSFLLHWNVASQCANLFPFNRWVWEWKQPSRVKMSSYFILHSGEIWLLTKLTTSLLLHCVIIDRTLFAVLL